ncbi:MAG: Ig-like domain-containing protein [Aequorivita sp.]
MTNIYLKLKKMKMKKLFHKTYILVLMLLAISCSTDETSDAVSNAIPVMRNQQFDVLENIEKFTTIAKLEASDPDGDKLTFQLKSDIDLTVDSTTGEIKTTANSFLDYETVTTHTFNVTVSDGKGGETTAPITLNVLDVDDGPLTNLQKSFVDEYIYVTYNLSPNSSGGELSQKWKDEVKLFIEGNLTTNYKQMVAGYLEEFNSLITDGTTLTLVDTVDESNVHLILGPPHLIKNVWPDMFNIIENSQYEGYAMHNWNSSNYIYKGRIWVESTRKNIFIHELGHILGLGHASDPYCVFENSSFMCSSARASEFNTFDIEIIKALYHPNTTVGLTQIEMRVLIEEYIIENSILQ